MATGNDAFTKFLLHFNGTDTSTTIVDTNVGGSAHTWTANGNAQLDTGITPKFGSAALLCDGTGDYVSTPDHADFTLGSGDWTLDGWFNVAGGAGGARKMYGQCNSTETTTTISLIGGLSAGNALAVQAYVGSTQHVIFSSTTFTSAGWHHFAHVRTGNVLKLFVDGVQEGGDLAIAGTVNDSANAWAIGRRGESTTTTWNGSVDEFRLSVGIARWTANFTPPTAEYGVDLVAAAGSFSLTGSVATLKRGYKVAAVSGVYSVTGSAAGLRLARRIVAVSGSYALTGTSASLEYGYKVAAASGSYTLNGSAVTLRKGITLNAASGAFTLTGSDASFSITGPPDELHPAAITRYRLNPAPAIAAKQKPSATSRPSLISRLQ
jgi:hypothetical protein